MSTDDLDVAADRKSTRLNSSHLVISYAVFCLKKKNAMGPRLAQIFGGPAIPLRSTPALDCATVRASGGSKCRHEGSLMISASIFISFSATAPPHVSPFLPTAPFSL